ncbi:VOC family protein [Vitreoscilla stercoraria]|uniref:VOC family protein n=1 Tax=Vitreoscilla stercoraria TaxID=61 RepID=A0ABY4EBU7_VITST|nr:VOC family protein [Vitreoscilla stercoraria]UOO92385.1 VOC family protein [Vitreoscilla stercoraria]
MSFSPFVMFDGDCEAAFVFYQSVFGGNVRLLRYSDAPLLEQASAALSPKIMFAQLDLGGQELLGCDTSENMYQPQQGMLVSWQGDTEEDVERIFEALSEGGMVRKALDYTFWTPKYGLVEDKFGVIWMISCRSHATL